MKRRAAKHGKEIHSDTLSSESVQTVAHNIRSILSAAKINETILALSDIAVMLTYNSDHISYCSESIYTLLGLDREKIISNGWPYVFQQIHPHDQELLKKKLFPSLRAYLKKYTPAEKDQLTFNYTFRMHHARGHYLLMAIENQPIGWEGRGWPVAYLSVVKNIAPFGNNHKMVLVINLCQPGERPRTVHRQEFDFRWETFSVREVEVIRLIAAQSMTPNALAEEFHQQAGSLKAHSNSDRA